MAAVWVTAPGLGWRLRSVRGCSVAGDVLERLTRDTGVSDFYVVCNGRVVDCEEQLQDGSVYRLEPRLRGGKGGFGSMLRALGAQIEKTTNREACRDLSGRRLRDVNHEKEMAEWLKKQSEREAEKEQRRLERLQKKLAEPKHHFTDSHYQQQCHELSERLEDSVLKGLQASSSSVVKAETSKRPSSGDTEGPETKRSRDAAFSWTGLDLLSSDEDLEEEEEPEGRGAWPEGRGAWPEPSSRSSSEHSPPQSEDQTGPTKTRSSPESSSSPEEDRRDPESSCRPEEDQRDPESSCRPEEDQRDPESSCRPEEDQRDPESSCRPEEDQRDPESSCRSEEDQRDPQTSCRPEEDQRDPQTSCRPEEDQRDPQTSCRPEEDQRDPQTSCRPEEDQRDPQTSCRPEEDQRDPQTSCRPEEDQRDPQTSCRPEEDQRDPESSCRPEEDQDSPQLGLDLDSVSSPVQLEALGLDVLKEELTRRGLKCGGTLSERAARLFSVRGKRPEEVDPALLAKKNRKQK